jgi:hypothetical protein
MRNEQLATTQPFEVETDEAGFLVCAAHYSLRIVSRTARALLKDAAGSLWSDLSLLASLDRTDRRDEALEIAEVRIGEQSAGRCEFLLSTTSSAWKTKTTHLLCTPEAVEIWVEVLGDGTLTDVSLLGGRAYLPDGACGMFRSSINFPGVFNPTPTEPVQVVRPSSSSVVLGVVGDADPGRLHGIFSPPPLMFGFGRGLPLTPTGVPAGEWLGISIVGAVADLTFPQCSYQPVDGGYLVSLDYDGHTEVSGHWRTPSLVLRPAATPEQAIRDYRNTLIERGFAASPASVPYAWWRQPIFCGWGAQCAGSLLAGKPASALARQDFYDDLLVGLAAADLDPGTIVIDDQWQSDYGLMTPDEDKWPDVRGWIAGQHGKGRKVLLWWKSWDPGAIPAEECITDPAGRPVSVDPANPAYRTRVRQIVHDLLSEEGLNADGFKIDFTQRAPMGSALVAAGPQWGIAALHLLLDTIYSAAKNTKPDALIITHTPHPSFGDVCDMVRLNDVLRLDPAGVPVSVVDQLRFRSAVVSAALPDHLIDTDQWPMPSREQWLAYADEQPRLGIPALYYVRSIGSSAESITADDLQAIALGWQTYRAGLLPSETRTVSPGLTYPELAQPA